MGCSQSSVATPSSDATTLGSRMSWVSRERRRRVRPLGSIPMVAPTQDSVETSLTRATPSVFFTRPHQRPVPVEMPLIRRTPSVFFARPHQRPEPVETPPIRVTPAVFFTRLHQRPVHPGISVVQEANPDSRVDLTHITSHGDQEEMNRQTTPTPSSLKDTPTPDNTVTVDPTPGSLSPAGQSSSLKDGTIHCVQGQFERDSNTNLPPTPQSPARIPDASSPVDPPTRPNTRVVRRFSLPPMESPSSLTAIQRLHNRLLTSSYPGAQRQTQQHCWSTPVPVITYHTVGSVRPPPVSVLREQQRIESRFREVQLQDPVMNGGRSNEECVARSRQAQNRKPPRRRRRQAQHVPRPTAALPSRRKEWARGLYDRFPPEEYNVRRGTYMRGSDNSFSSDDSSDDSSSSFYSECEVALPRPSPTQPEIPDRMEIPDDPNILARPSTRGGVAFEYLFEPSRPQTPLVPRPVSPRTRRLRRRRTRAELELQQHLAEIRRMQQREEMLARLREHEDREREMRAGMDKFMHSQLEKERLEKMKKAKKENPSLRRPAPRLAHDGMPAFTYRGAQ